MFDILVNVNRILGSKSRWRIVECFFVLFTQIDDRRASLFLAFRFRLNIADSYIQLRHESEHLQSPVHGQRQRDREKSVPLRWFSVEFLLNTKAAKSRKKKPSSNNEFFPSYERQIPCAKLKEKNKWKWQRGLAQMKSFRMMMKIKTNCHHASMGYFFCAFAFALCFVSSFPLASAKSINLTFCQHRVKCGRLSFSLYIISHRSIFRSVVVVLVVFESLSTGDVRC